MIGAVCGLLVVWIGLAAGLVVAGRRYGSPTLREIMRLLPDTVRMLHRLAKDRDLERGVRVRLWALLAYLALPIDLIPDFVPVVGYADDAIIVALTLRSVTRRAGPQALARHWPGTPLGLSSVLLVCGRATQTGNLICDRVRRRA